MAAVNCKNLIANRSNTLAARLQQSLIKNNMKEAILSLWRAGLLQSEVRSPVWCLPLL
jgi:hypothetical protein